MGTMIKFCCLFLAAILFVVVVAVAMISSKDVGTLMYYGIQFF